MPGMVHSHSAMNHPSVEAMSAMLASQSCQSSCVTAGRLNSLRAMVPHVTVVENGSVVLVAAEFLMPHRASEWGLDSGPPAPPSAAIAAFSILRV